MEYNDEQQRAIKYVSEGHNLFLTGPAGVGKSCTVKEMVRVLRMKNKVIAITASTGIAADHIGGCTLHSFAGCGLAKESATVLAGRIRRNAAAVERWVKTDVLVIDEVSMIDPEFFSKLATIAQQLRGCSLPFGGIQLILVGDFYQLPPVQHMKKDPFYLFQSDTWNLCIEKQVLLNRVYRQENAEFVDILMQIRECKMTKETIAKIKSTARHTFEGDILPTRLFCKNFDVECMNMRELEKIAGDVTKYVSRDHYSDKDMETKYQKNFVFKNTLCLKVGAQVILLVNKPDLGLVNGSRGIVENLGKETVSVKFSNNVTADIGREIREVKDDNEEVIASRTQFPLALAWCMTIHKSQGQTIELLDIDLKDVFTYAQVYVALSRGVDLKNMRVLNFDPTKVRTAKSVLHYYRGIKEDTETLMQKRARVLFEPATAKRQKS